MMGALPCLFRNWMNIIIRRKEHARNLTAPRILEVGFGTGLNAWLTLEEAEQSGRHIHYTGLELYPLEWQTVEELGYVRNDEQLLVNGELQPSIELFKQLHTSPWQEDVQLTPHFTLRKMEKDANQLEHFQLPIRFGLLRRFRPRKATGNVVSRTIQLSSRFIRRRRNPDYLLCQRGCPENVTNSRIHSRTPSGTSGRKTGDITRPKNKKREIR